MTTTVDDTWRGFAAVHGGDETELRTADGVRAAQGRQLRQLPG
ncbi:hypothetical protein [Cryptosporangium japonicum]